MFCRNSSLHEPQQKDYRIFTHIFTVSTNNSGGTKARPKSCSRWATNPNLHAATNEQRKNKVHSRPGLEGLEEEKYCSTLSLTPR
jgi:hypothetical protein